MNSIGSVGEIRSENNNVNNKWCELVIKHRRKEGMDFDNLLSDETSSLIPSGRGRRVNAPSPSGMEIDTGPTRTELGGPKPNPKQKPKPKPKPDPTPQPSQRRVARGRKQEGVAPDPRLLEGGTDDHRMVDEGEDNKRPTRPIPSSVPALANQLPEEELRRRQAIAEDYFKSNQGQRRQPGLKQAFALNGDIEMSLAAAPPSADELREWMIGDERTYNRFSTRSVDPTEVPKFESNASWGDRIKQFAMPSTKPGQVINGVANLYLSGGENTNWKGDSSALPNPLLANKDPRNSEEPEGAAQVGFGVGSNGEGEDEWARADRGRGDDDDDVFHQDASDEEDGEDEDDPDELVVPMAGKRKAERGGTTTGMTVMQLRQLCRENGLKVSGKKDDLIERLKGLPK